MAPPVFIDPRDPRLSWFGNLEIRETPRGGVEPLRLPAAASGGSVPSGGRLVFVSDTRELALQIRGGMARPLDVCCNGRLVASLRADAAGWVRHEGLPPGQKRIELWLPSGAGFELVRVGLSAGSTLRRAPDGRLRWLACGGRFTEAAEAPTPTAAWPAMVARSRDLNLINLGFAGGGWLAPALARAIRDQPVDALSICLEGGEGARDGLWRDVGQFIDIVRERHTEVPIALVSLPWGCDADEESGRAQNTLRHRASGLIASRSKAGDSGVFYTAGIGFPDTLNPVWSALKADGAESHREIAAWFEHLVGPRLFVGTGRSALEAVRRSQGIADVAVARGGAKVPQPSVRR